MILAAKVWNENEIVVYFCSILVENPAKVWQYVKYSLILHAMNYKQVYTIAIRNNLYEPDYEKTDYTDCHRLAVIHHHHGGSAVI
jgi:hypothetical protein